MNRKHEVLRRSLSSLDSMGKDHYYTGLKHDFFRHLLIIAGKHKNGLFTGNATANVVVVDPSVVLARF